MAPIKNISKSEQEALNELIERVRAVFSYEKKSTSLVGALAKLYPDAVANVKKGNGSMLSLLKVMHVMGYDIAFVRARKPLEISNDVDAIARLSKLKKTNKNSRKKHEANKKIPTQEQLREQFDRELKGGTFL